MRKNRIIDFFNDIKINSHLCSRCGGCIAICPAKAVFLKKTQSQYNIEYDEKKCIGCERCLEICPSRRININKIKNYHDTIGNYLFTYKGHSRNERIRKNGNSGGIATNILKFGIENKIFDKVICLQNGKSYPFDNQALITNKSSDLFKCAGSKYKSYPICTALRNIDRKKKLAITCLPCHAKAIKNMRLKNVFIIGLFCSNQINQDFMAYLLRKENVNSSRVKKILYRHGKWPGKLLIVEKNNKKIEVNFNHNYPAAAFNSQFFTPTHCLLCDDVFCESADISLGDPWKVDGYYENFGNNLIISRTKWGEKVIQAMALKREISIEKITPQKVLFSQISSVEKKKIGIYSRIKLLRMLAIKLPKSMRIKKPLSSVKLVFSYPLELMNIFNCFYVKKYRLFYRLIFTLPKSFIFIYRSFFLVLLRVYEKVVNLK